MTSTEYLQSLRALADFHRGLGITRYCLKETGLSGVRFLDEMSRRKTSAETTPALPPLSGNKSRVSQTSVEKRQALSELSAEIAGCVNCQLHRNRRIDTAGEGGEHPALLIVGDWLVIDQDAKVLDTSVFGVAQDEMLARMLKAIKLPPLDVYITNVVKCSILPSCTPTREQIEICAAYLKRQVELLDPDVICAMGNVAVQSLLGTDLPMFKLRGRFHFYRSLSGKQIPLMPTIHPGFLLENPEMKQAAWHDLQMLQKKMGERDAQEVRSLNRAR